MASKHVRVGVAAIIHDGHGRLVVGQRSGSHGAGTWQLPGGHLELMETPEQCAERETKEETDLDVDAVRIAATTNDMFVSDSKHYITLFVLCRLRDARAQPRVSLPDAQNTTDQADGVQIMEPDKCTAWTWMTWQELERKEEELFLPLRNLLRQTKDLQSLLEDN